MVKIRLGVFETNSSSVHSMVMCNDDEYQGFSKGQLYYSWDTNEFYTFDEALQLLVKRYRDHHYSKYMLQNLNEWVADADENTKTYFSSDEFTVENLKKADIDAINNFLREEAEICSFNNMSRDFEGFHDSYTTSSGEVVHAFGYYGEDR